MLHQVPCLLLLVQLLIQRRQVAPLKVLMLEKEVNSMKQSKPVAMKFVLAKLLLYQTCQSPVRPKWPGTA